MNKKKKSKKVDAVISAYKDSNPIQSDPQGSYTGEPENKYDKPVQDADDL